MIKRGFTLAEVLITLMIVGFVAILAIGALSTKISSTKIGPKLSKVVNTWENAAETLMMEENASDLNSVIDPKAKNPSTGRCFIMDKMTKHMSIENLDGVSIDIENAKGSSVIGKLTSDGGAMWKFKDNTIVYFDANPAIDYQGGEFSSYKGAYATLYVDIAGLKGPHRAGQEVFKFIIDNSGSLIPVGSRLYNSMAAESSGEIQCDHEGSTDEQYACTGAVADNNWKAPW